MLNYPLLSLVLIYYFQTKVKFKSILFCNNRIHRPSNERLVKYKDNFTCGDICYRKNAKNMNQNTWLQTWKYCHVANYFGSFLRNFNIIYPDYSNLLSCSMANLYRLENRIITIIHFIMNTFIWINNLQALLLKSFIHFNKKII